MRTVKRGPLQQQAEPEPERPTAPPPARGDRVIDCKDGSRWFVDGATGWCTRLKGGGPAAKK